MKQALFPVILFFSILICSPVKAQQPVSRIDPNARISFADTVVEFGIITLQDSLVRVVNFKNTGTVPLVFFDAVSECGCARIVLPRKAVKPGKNGKLKIIFKSPYLGSIEKRITMVSSAGISYLSYHAYVKE